MEYIKVEDTRSMAMAQFELGYIANEFGIPDIPSVPGDACYMAIEHRRCVGISMMDEGELCLLYVHGIYRDRGVGTMLLNYITANQSTSDVLDMKAAMKRLTEMYSLDMPREERNVISTGVVRMLEHIYGPEIPKLFMPSNKASRKVYRELKNLDEYTVRATAMWYGLFDLERNASTIAAMLCIPTSDVQFLVKKATDYFQQFEVKKRVFGALGFEPRAIDAGGLAITGVSESGLPGLPALEDMMAKPENDECLAMLEAALKAMKEAGGLQFKDKECDMDLYFDSAQKGPNGYTVYISHYPEELRD